MRIPVAGLRVPRPVGSYSLIQATIRAARWESAGVNNAGSGRFISSSSTGRGSTVCSVSAATGASNCKYADEGESKGGCENRYILYIKPAYHGTEDAGIRSCELHSIEQGLA
jgi:hypothetical protein